MWCVSLSVSFVSAIFLLHIYTVEYIVQRGEICFRTASIIGNLFGYWDDNELFSLTQTSLTLNMILINSVSSSSRNFLRISLQTSSKYITPFFSTWSVLVSRVNLSHWFRLLPRPNKCRNSSGSLWWLKFFNFLATSFALEVEVFLIDLAIFFYCWFL